MFQVPLAGQSINNAQIGIETNISSSSATIGNASITNATVGQLSTTIFNPATVTTTTIDANIGQIRTLTVTNPIANLLATQLNACSINACNISCINVSASQITCDNLQPLLTAGTNISIVDGVISAANEALLPSVAGFHTVNSSIVNSSFFVSNQANMFHTSTVSISSNHASFVALTAGNLSTGNLNFGSNLSYESITKHLDVNTTGFVTENDERPVTSWGVYKEFVNRLTNQVNNIMTVRLYKLSDSAVTLVATQVPAGGSNTIFRVNFTPQYEGSRIAVEVCYPYTVAGFGTDRIITQLKVGVNDNTSQLTIQQLYQEWTDANGGGTRSAASGSIMGVYDNTDTLGKFHRVYLFINNTSNDLWELSDINLPAIKITEILEIDTVNNPNIRIGEGNISCGNLSCTRISVANFTVEEGDITTTEGVNAGGGIITTGFKPDGTVAALSRIRMGSGNFINYADETWDGTTFNISLRQANKNFKVSISGVEYLQVNVSNTSTRDLQVNGNLNVTGAINLSALTLNGQMSADGGLFYAPSMFEDNVSIHKRLNVSNVSITQNLWVNNISARGTLNLFGNLSCGGNISAQNGYFANLSTANLVAGQNISIINGSISAFIQGGNDIDVRNLHVDEDLDVIGILNVCQTSNFEQSLNVCNILYAGKTGQHDGSIVVYSQEVGKNWATKFDGNSLNMSATGTATEANIWVGGNKTLTVTPTGVNISGTITASQFNFSLDNISITNLSAVTITADSIVAPNVQPTITAGTGISISGNVISGTETLTSGNNISILNNIVSTTPNINVSNMSFTGLSPKLSMGGLGSIFGVGTYTGIGANLSQVNTSTINISNPDVDCLNVSGIVNMDYFFTTVGQNSFIQGRNTYFGQPTPVGSESVINFYSTIGAQSIGTRMGNTSNEAFIKTSTQFGAGVDTFTMNISNTSVMSMTHTSTKYNHNVNVSGTLTATSISAPNLSTASLGLSSDLYILSNVLYVDFSSATDAATAEVNGLASALASNVSTTNVSAVFGTIGLLTINTLANAPTINTSLLNSSDIDSVLGEIDNLSSINFSSSLITTNTLTTTGAVGIGINNPERLFHVRGANATWRLDRDRPAPALQLHRFDTNFVGAPLKGFVIGVDASSANNGNFFINDFAQNVTGNSTTRFTIENDGQVTIAGKLSVGGGIIADNFSVADTNGNTIIGGTLGVTGRITTTNMSLTNISSTLITTGTIRSTTCNGEVMNSSNSNISTKLTVPNISSARANFTTDIITPKVTTEALNTSSSLNFNINNVPSMELGAALFMYTDIQGTNGYFTGNLSAINGSFTTLSASSITAPNVQATLIAGSGINISGTTISTTQTLVAGNNIQIVGNDISTTTTINSSVHNAETMNTSLLNTSDIDSILGEIDNLSSTNFSATTATITTLRSTTQNANTVNTSQLNASNFAVTGTFNIGQLESGLINVSTINSSSATSLTYNAGTMNGSGVNASLLRVNNMSILGTGTLDGYLIKSITTNANTLNCSNINVSAKVSCVNLSLTNMSATLITPTTIRATTSNGTTMNCSNINISTKIHGTNLSITNISSTLITTGTIRATTSNGTTMNASNVNISTLLTTTNVSATDITASGSITAPNLSTASMIIGSGLNFSNNTLTSTGGTTLTAGNNISILNDTISTTTSVSVSTLNVNTSITAGYVNSTQLTAGSGGLTVTGITNLNSLIVSAPGATSLGTDEVTIGKSNACGTQSYLTFWSPQIAQEVSLQMGIFNDGVCQIKIPNHGQARQEFNINISNQSYMTMRNQSTTFHQPLKATTITSTNICNTNLSGSLATITTIRATTSNGTTINASNLNISTKLTTTNISATNISATSITAPNLSTASMIIGSGLNFSNNTLTSTGGTTLTAGNNISILNDIISTTATINSSVHTAETMNTSILNASDIDSILGEIDNLSSINFSSNLITTGTLRSTTCDGTNMNASTINCSNQISCVTLSANAVNATTCTGDTINATSNINCSLKVSCFNLSATNASFTTLTCSSNISFPIGFGLYRDFTGLLNVSEVAIRGLFGATFSATTGNFSKINVSNMSFTGLSPKLSMGGLGDIFGVGTYTGIGANVSQLNASNASTINLSATNITATSIVAANVQPTLTIGNNLQLVGNTISTSTTINSSVHNAQTINTSNINISTKVHTTNLSTTNFSGGLGTFSGDLTLNGLLNLNQQPRFLAFYSGTTPKVVNVNEILPYNTIVYQVGGGFDTTTSTYTVPVAGLYFFMCSFSTRATTCDVYLEKNGTSIQRCKKTGATTEDTTLFCTVLSPCAVGNTIRCVNRVNSIRLTSQAGFPQGFHQFSATRIG